MFATAARWAAKKGKPKMAPIELTTPPEQTQSITRAIFDVVREHGPLTISDVWEQVKVSAIPLATRLYGHLGITPRARKLFDRMAFQ